MSDAHTAVIWLAIATAVIGALVFGGSLWVYSMGNRVGDKGAGGSGTEGKKPAKKN